MIDYKKAWATLKTELTKNGDPYELKGCMHLTPQQLRGRTSTILLTNLVPYEKEIEAREEFIAKVMANDSFTDEEKAKLKAEHEAMIVKYTEKLNLYGTKRNEAEVKIKNITSTDAWKVFEETISIKRLYLDKKFGCLYFRIHY